MKELDLKYDFKKVEKGKYKKWVEKGYFTAGDTSKHIQSCFHHQILPVNYI